MTPRRPIFFTGGLVFRGDGESPRQEDILLQGSQITVGPSLTCPRDADIIPLNGLSISPGWVDLHTHVFRSNGVFSVDPGAIGLRAGVTTLVDAGSAGAFQYKAFAEDVIQKAQEKIFAYVNVSNPGIVHGHAGRPGFVGDHFHRSFHEVEPALDLLERHSSSIVGWKARLTAVLADNDPELEAQAFARLCQLRERSGLPVMVHHIESSIPTDHLLENLAPRDVYTHLYHGREDTIFDRQTGAPSEAALKARGRGVVFDVGHGCGSFSWSLAEKACAEHGFWPDTISSDLHRYNTFGPVVDLATTMSKFLHLGATEAQVIAMVTGNVGRAIPTIQGTLEAGDLTIFTIEDGQFPMVDAQGKYRTCQRRFLPLVVAKEGELIPCHAYATHGAGSDEFARSLQAAAAY